MILRWMTRPHRPLATLLASTLLLPTLLCAQAPSPQPGEPAAAKEPGKQAEKDWVDARWSQTDVGPFLASSLQTPAGMVTKALSIRVGAQGEAAVCYDTGRATWRAAWTGGFLKFSAGRFGLIAPPAAAGEWAFSSGTGAGWLEAKARHEAIHVNGHRLVLEARAGDTLVRETPWFETVGGLGIFTRTIEVGPGQTALTLVVHEQTGAMLVSVKNGLAVASDEGKERVTAIGCRAGSKAQLSASGGSVRVNFPAQAETQRVKLFLWAGPGAKLAEFAKVAATSSAAEDLAELARPGPARWLPALTNAGQIGFPTEGFALDTITVPYANPWKALMFCSGVDFFADGSAAVSTIHGDVWRISGLDDRLRAVTWKRYATGLFQPLGLRVVNDRVHVLGRDQITILHDDNRDGEADRYENFCNLIETSAGGHDYVTCLERDAAGSFYYVDPAGVHRLSADGKGKETLGTGFRNPNGLGIGPQGVITVTPQQGNWTPSSALFEVKPGGYYGYGGPRMTAQRPLGYDTPLCWLPHAFDNSSSSQVWTPAEAWGALGGQMFHLLWGRCSMALILRDEVDGQAQGAAVGLPVRFLSGPMRGTFHPRDGHLYVAGSTGWQTSAAREGSLQRVRRTSAEVRTPVAWRAHGNGLKLTFAQSLDRAAAEDAGSYSIRQWNYRYAAGYGSKDYSVTDPSKEGRDEVVIRSVRVLPDGKTVFLEIPEFRPVMQMEVKYNLRFIGGAAAAGPLYLTVNRLAAALALAPVN